VARRTQTARPPAEPPRRPVGPRLRAAIERFGFVIVAVVAIGGAVAYGVLQGTRDRRRGVAEPTSAQTTPAPQAPFRSEQEAAHGRPVREVFAHTCGTCHTLRRAGVQGIIGPNLDEVVLTPRRVRRMIRTGSLDTVMPRNLLVGADADRVARYVARQSLASRRARAGR
jgi:mono/diheme cytochrome c family protein